MFLEIDEVAVPHAIVAKLRSGDREAITSASEELRGVQLYMHALSADLKDYDVLTLRELSELGVVEFVTVGDFGAGRCAFEPKVKAVEGSEL